MTIQRAQFSPLFLATLLVLGSLCTLHPQFITLISSHFIGGALGDGGLYVWLASSFHADPQSALAFQTNAFYPYSNTRAWSDLFFLPSAITHLLMRVGLSLEISYNLTALGAMACNGLGLFVLCRTLACAWLSSMCAAILFANCSYLVGNLGHPQLMHIFWIPFTWSLLLSERRSLRKWLLAGMCVTGAFYSSVYYAVFAATGIGVISLLQLTSRQRSLREILQGSFAASIGMLPISYALPAYLAVKETFGSRGLHEAEAFAASGLSYLAFSSFHPLFGATSAWTHAEATLCVGYFTIFVLMVGLFRLSRQRITWPHLILASSVLILGASSSLVDSSTTTEWVTNISVWLTLLFAIVVSLRAPSSKTILFALVSLFFVLSFGPGGSLHKNEPAFAPLTLLYAIVPGFDVIRATGRCGSIVIIGAFVCLAGIFTALEKSALRSRYALIAAICAAIAFENFIPTPPLDPASIPPLAFSALSKQIAPKEAVLFLPFSNSVERGRVQSWSDFAILNTQYAQWTAPLKIKTVNGYSGQRSKIINELPVALAHFPSGDWPDFLARICGASWIVVTPLWAPRLTGAPLPEGITLEQRFSDGSALLKVSRSITITPETSAPIFAPHNSPLSFVRTNPMCPIVLSNLTKSKENVFQSPPLSTTISNDGMRLSLEDLLLPSKTPLLLVAHSVSCSTTIRCEP